MQTRRVPAADAGRRRRPCFPQQDESDRLLHRRDDRRDLVRRQRPDDVAPVRGSGAPTGRLIPVVEPDTTEGQCSSENIKRLVAETEGGVAGLLMGFDGIAVDSYTAPEGGVDIQTVGMEFCFILRQVRKAGRDPRGRRRSRRSSIRRRSAHDAHAACCRRSTSWRSRSRPEGNFGKAATSLRVVAPKLQAELA